MANETTLTLIGNLVDDPEIRFIPSGTPVVKFRIASTPRTFNRQTGQWDDGEALFLTCNIWRQPAEHVAESLQRGHRVIVVGRLKQRSYETREGEKRTVYEIDVEEIGPSLRFATARINKTTRSTNGASTSTTGATTGATPTGPAPDPWAVPAGTGADGSGDPLAPPF